MVDVAESQFGLICLIKIATETEYYDLKSAAERQTIREEMRDKFTAMAFFEGSNKKKYGKLLTNLINDYLRGSKIIQKAWRMVLKYLWIFMIQKQGTGTATTIQQQTTNRTKTAMIPMKNQSYHLQPLSWI